MSINEKTPIASPSTIYLGTGKIYINYEEVDEAVIGATKEGGEFRDNAEFRQREADGDLGPVKGAIDLVKMEPMFSFKTLKIDNDNIQKVFAGMVLDDTDAIYSKLTRTVDLSDSYAKNIAYVGQNRSGKELIIILYNAIGLNVFQLAAAKNDEMLLNVEFIATFDPSTFDSLDESTYPYQIWLEK